MSDIALGTICRKNFGQMPKYSPTLDIVYQGYIDTLEQAMIYATYGTNISSTTITQTMYITPTSSYETLVSAIVQFCQLHDVGVAMQLGNDDNGSFVIVTVNMLSIFTVSVSS